MKHQSIIWTTIVWTRIVTPSQKQKLKERRTSLEVVVVPFERSR
ncbi:MAG TPA: hypothetical protein VN643_20010 [Pyrinomonadaceae bacterium]|nr:hypothetical protein [Pyrinomonadaceae bacterium]